MLCVRGRNTQIPWWVEADIGKIEIESNEDSSLGQADIENCGICTSPEPFFKHRLHIVAGVAKQYLGVARQVLVQLESNGHPPGLCGDGNNSLTRQFGGVADCGGNMLKL